MGQLDKCSEGTALYINISRFDVVCQNRNQMIEYKDSYQTVSSH